MNIPEDGIEEVRVETQNTPASYQSGAAGVISLVSKSGTNKFHGDVFGVFRPNALSANEYFTKQDQIARRPKNTPPDFHRYQEGGAIGGPIKKDKLFFFADYEHTTQQQFEGNRTYQVPTSAERTGDFSHMGFTIYDPTLPDNLAALRQAVSRKQNHEPESHRLAVSAEHAEVQLPRPDNLRCGDHGQPEYGPNFQLPGLDPFTANRFDVRVDWNASDKQRIFTRFSYDKLVFSTANVFPAPGGTPTMP